MANFFRRLTRIRKWAALAFVVAGAWLPRTAGAVGTWVPVMNQPPGPVGLMLLLPDGTVMAQAYGPSSAWYRLTPDAHGSYATGMWTTTAPMHDTRQYYSAAVLRDGRIFVAGGEYGTGGTAAEVYDPQADTWTSVPVPASLLDPAENSPILASPRPEAFLDSISETLPNGNVLIAPVADKYAHETVIFSAVSNAFFPGPNLTGSAYEDEASWVKLPDDSILTIDPFGRHTERYLPSLNIWEPDADVVTSIYDPIADEMGAALLLPNGNAFFIGATGHTAIYTPTGDSTSGTWAAGPDLPNGQGTPDAPAAMMVNGKILCAVSPIPVTTNHYPTPTSFYEYDYSAGPVGAFTQVNSPQGGPTESGVPFATVMLDLPDGSVLYSDTFYQLYLYQPDGSPLAAGKPAITSVSKNADGSYHLTGTQLNGISAGAAYGDDAQMDSNYPLVRLTDAAGNVYYARSYNWSGTSVMTGNRVVTTEFKLPAGLAVGTYSLVVVANGISSDPVSLSLPRTVTSLADNGPGSLRNTIAASGKGDIIQFANGLTGTITLTNGELVITNDLTITGPGRQGVILNGNHNDRVFHVTNATVSLTGLTIFNGFAPVGGGLYNQGTVWLSNCTVTGNNSISYGGGGLWNDGTMFINNCTVCSNVAAVFGGGGGGIYNNVGHTMAITNSTICLNQSSYFGGGGGIFNAGPLTVTSCTIASNTVTATVGDGGGIQNWNLNPVLTIKNSIVAGNSTLSVTNPDVSGVFNGIGFNLVGVTNGSSGWNGGFNFGNQLGSLAAPVSAQLGALRDNGGPAFTMAPQPGSPAIDNGSGFGLTTDERGAQRPFDFANFTNAAHGNGSDIGAFELSAPGLSLAFSAGSSLLSWPSNYPGYGLEASRSLSPATWTNVPGTPAIIGGQFVLPGGTAASNQFFRLVLTNF